VAKKVRLCHAGNQEGNSTFAHAGNRSPIDLLYGPVNCGGINVRKIGSPQAVARCGHGRGFGFRGAPRSVRSGSATAAGSAAATGVRSGPAATAGPGCPRLTGWSRRDNTPGSAPRIIDQAAIERGAGERQRDALSPAPSGGDRSLIHAPNALAVAT